MKVWTYFYIGVFLLLLFNFSGILSGTGSNLEIGYGKSGDDITFNPYLLLVTLTGLLTGIGVAVGAIAIGVATKSSIENYILIPIITGVLGALIGVFLAIWNATAGMGYIRFIVALLIIPFTTGYIIALAEWFRGTD